jgi:FkbM family methyltransferase
VESKLWFDKSWVDPTLLEVRRRGFIGPGSVAFDLGCNSGAITIPMAMQAGPAGHVHAFDPYPWNAAATQASVNLNRLDNVTAHRVGLSNKTHAIKVSPNDSRIYEQSSDRSAQSLDIRNIAEYMHLKPSYMKIDIEGAEHELFDVGDPHLFDCVEAAMLEFHPMWIAPRGLDCRDTLRNVVKHGFALRYYSPDAAAYDVEKYSHKHHLFWLLRPKA